ncbi:ArnT family glycosyltransferase [Verrucomicrobiota bacterium sgz303538]
MTPRRLLFIFLAALTLWRLIYIRQVELSADEAYYTMWSERMDYSYYSKGPGIAATIWLGTHLFGHNEFGVRVFSPLLALGTSLLLFALARRLFTESIAIWAVLALNCIPIFQVGGLVMTIDPLSIFFWTAAIYTFWRALERSPEFSGWWPATGALIGLGWLCKWTNAMQLLSIVLLLLLTGKYRKEFRRRSFWLMLASFLPFVIPPILWNARHNWITYQHVSARAGIQKSTQISPGEFFTFLGAHFGVYSPLIFGAMLVALWWGWDRARAHFKPRFLLSFAVPLLVMYFGLSLWNAGEANWTAPAAVSLGLLTVVLWHEKSEEHRWARRFSLTALIVGLVMSLITLDTDILRRIGIPLSYSTDPSARLRGWKSTAELVQSFRQEFEKQQGRPVFLIANKYQTSAALAFYMDHPSVEGPGHPPVYIPESQAIENQFSFWPRYDELADLRQIGKDILASPAPANADPQLREELARTLAALPPDEESASPKGADAWRNYFRALRALRPELAIDESFVEQHGVNLFAGRSALYITDRSEEKPPSSIKSGFEHVEMIACIDLMRRGLPLRQIRIFACHNYKGGMSL